MKRIGGHAIVIGASMGGLLAARALSEFFANVMVLERDAFPASDIPRKGVPQDRHAHGARSAKVRFINWYVGKLHKAARHDAELAFAFLQVANLKAPPERLLHPAVVARVIRGNLRRGEGDGAAARAGAQA